MRPPPLPRAEIPEWQLVMADRAQLALMPVVLAACVVVQMLISGDATIEWVKTRGEGMVIHVGPERGRKCARSACKSNRPASYWNKSTRNWYCPPCAHMINAWNPGLCEVA